MTPVQPRRHEHGLDPRHIDGKVAVVRHAVDRGNRNRRVRPPPPACRSGRALLVPERTATSSPTCVCASSRTRRGAASSGGPCERSIVHSSDADRRAPRTRRSRTRSAATTNCAATGRLSTPARSGPSFELRQLRSEHEDRYRGRENRQAVPRQISREVRPRRRQYPESQAPGSLERGDDAIDDAQSGNGKYEAHQVLQNVTVVASSQMATMVAMHDLGPLSSRLMSDERRRWVLLAYRMPREPSTPRIAVWRKLRRLGVAQIVDGLVAVPESIDQRRADGLDRQRCARRRR